MISVLYVDDEPDLLELAQIFLEQSGTFQVTTSTSAQEMLGSGNLPTYDAIVSDYQMPALDGIGFLKAVRERYTDLPFILFTGRGREEVVIEALNNGADFYIQKGGAPQAQFAELANKIRYAVSRRCAEKELQRKNDELNASYEQIAANEEELRQQLDELTAKQEALKDSEERFRAFTENVPDLTTIADINGTYTYISPSIRRISGHDADDLLGKRIETRGDLFGIFPEDADIVSGSGRAAIQNPGKTQPVPPFRVRDSNGETVFIEGTITFLPQVKGIQGLLFHGRDISDRIRAEEELQTKNDELNASYEQITASEEELRGQYEELAWSSRMLGESEEKFRSLFEKTRDALVLLSNDGCIDCNQQALELFGFSSKEEFMGLKPVDLSPPFQPGGEDTQSAAAAHTRTVIVKGVDHFEWTHQRKDKSTFPADILLSSFTLDGQQVFLSSIRDITERKRMEDELQLLKISVERSSDEVFWLDFQGNILYVNEAACRITGYSPEEFQAMKVFDLDPDFPPEVWAQFIADLREKKTCFITTRHRCKDGTILDVEVVSVYVNKEDREYSFAFVRDVTTRKVAERERQDTIAFLNALIDQNPHSMWVSDEKGFLIRMNAACGRLLHSTEQELVGKYNIFQDPVLEAQGFLPLIRSVFEEGKVVSFPLDYDSARLASLPLKETVSLSLEVTIFPIKDADGKLTNAVVIHNDITERKRAEQVLAESEERYRTLVNSSFDGIAIHQDGILVFVNPTAARILGSADPSVFLGKPVINIVHPDDRSQIADRILRSPDNPQDLIHERFLRVDGSFVHVDVATTPCTWNGRPAAYVTFRDISEQKRAEEEIFQSHQMLQAVLDAIPQRVFWKDRNSVYLGCNKPLSRDAGYPDPTGIVGKTDYDTAYRDTAEIYRADDRRVMETGQARINYEEPQDRPDGSKAWLRTSKVPLYDKEGNVIGVLGTYEDITATKQKEEALRESEEKYRTLVENANEAIAIVQDWRIVFVNKRGADLLGTAATDIVGQRFMEYIWPDDRERLNAHHSVRLAGGAVPETYDFRIIGTERRPVWVSNSTAAIMWQGKPATLSLMTDVTERKFAEAALKESEETFRKVIEGAPEAIYIGADEKFVYLNPAALRLFGAESGNQLIGTPFLDRIHPRFHDAIRERVKSLCEYFLPAPPLEEVYLRLDGTEIEVEVTAVPFRYIGRDGALVFVWNIADRKKAERARQESEEKYRRILENIQDAYFQTDKDGSLTMANLSAARMFGYSSPEEMIGIPATVLYDSPSQRQDMLRQLQEHGRLSDFSGTSRRKDGTTFWTSLSVRFITGTDGTVIGTEGIVRDMTERKSLEQAIREANRKLNLLNNITRHDINNQLTVLRGYAQLAEMRDADPVVSDFMRKIEISADTIARQIEFTKTYQELAINTPSWFRLDEIIANAGRPEVAFSPTCRGIEIFADPMLERVFFNLFDNAIRHGGHVTTIGVRCERAPDGLVILIEDDGVGIAPEEKEKIFEKGVGKNTGYGLFLSREILAITGITIRETGYLGVGARFEITVPKEKWQTVTGND